MDNIFGINLAIFFELIKKLINFAMQTKNKRITIRILSVVKTFREGNRSPFSIFLANYLHNRQFIAIFVKILAYRKDA